jgi:hypothetical protein
VLQSEIFVVVEGATDAQRLNGLLPLELGRAVVFEGGSAQGVEATIKTLDGGAAPLPYIGVRDRDLLTEEEAAKLAADSPNLFVWPRRVLENELLHPPLVSRTIARSGVEMPEEEIHAIIRHFADEQREDIHAALVEAELKRRFAYISEGETPLEKLRSFISSVAETSADKLAVFEEVADEVRLELDSRWESDHAVLLDGKRALGQFVGRTPFRSTTDFVAALTQTAREVESVTPPGVVALRRRLAELAARRPETSS